MIKIGLLSDTHGFLDPKLFEFFKDVDEVWHAGDFGTIEISDKLAEFKPLKGVYGNIDGQDIRLTHPLHQRFMCEGVDVWITHIGGYPGNYDRKVKESIYLKPPNLFICGHSHILKVMPDKKFKNFLHINPGAAGKIGIHKVSTAVRFQVNNDKIEELEIIELRER
ncbi:MAG: metallophosphoesterase family protein [Bacteroidia bacterium]|nr:metallophosphoesterase family protein [Bacteroidia bacterium]